MINAGISGNNTLQGLERLDRDVLRLSPDLVTVCFGLNDCCNGESFIDAYSRNLGEIFDRCLACGADVIFLTPNRMNTRVMYEPCEVIANRPLHHWAKAYRTSFPFRTERMPVRSHGTAFPFSSVKVRGRSLTNPVVPASQSVI